MAEALLDARSLHYTLPSGRSLLDDVSIALGTCESVGIGGSNGAGKTTLLRILAGLVRPDRGHVLMNGTPIAERPRRETARLMGYLPQSETVAFPVTAMAMVLFGRYPHMAGERMIENAEDRDQAERAMRVAGVYALKDRAYQRLSGGERMRVRIARLLAQQPRLLMLDEPTTYLDDDFKADLVAMMRERIQGGLAAVVVSHEVEFLEKVCSRVYWLEKGRLLGPDEYKERPK